MIKKTIRHHKGNEYVFIVTRDGIEQYRIYLTKEMANIMITAMYERKNVEKNNGRDMDYYFV